MSGRPATGTDTELLALQSKITPGLVCDRAPGVGDAGVQGRGHGLEGQPLCRRPAGEVAGLGFPPVVWAVPEDPWPRARL